MRFSWSRVSEWAVLAVLAFSILWRGGKGIEATWLLAFVAVFVICVNAVRRVFRMDVEANASPLAPPPRRIEVPAFLWGVVVLFMFWITLSYLFSTTKNYGLDEVMRAVSLSLLLLWTVRTGLDGKQRMLFLTARVVSYAAIIAAIVGIAVYVLQPVDRFVGTFFDYRFTTDYWPNAWAEFALLAWPLIIIESMRVQKKWLHWVLLFGVGLVVGSLLLSYSRGGIIAFFVQLLLFVLLFSYLGLRDVRYRRILRGVRNLTLARLVLVAVFVLGMFLCVNLLRSHFHEVQSVTQKITFTASEGTSSIDERKEFWQQALALSKQHPVIGFGPYSFRFIQTHVADYVLATSDHPHNVFLKLAVESGWPAAIFFACILLYVIGISLKMLFTERREWSQEKDINTIMLLLVVIGVIAHNLIDYNLQFVGIAMPLWLCLGFLVAPVTSHQESSSASFVRWKFSRYFLWLKILIALALLLVSLLEGYRLILSSLGRHAETAGNIDQAIGWYTKANGEWFSRDMLLSEAQLYLQKNDTAHALQEVDQYLAANSQDARAWKVRALVGQKMNDETVMDESIDHAYADGKYTDLQNLELLLETGKNPQRMKMLLPRKNEFDTVFSDYANAIENDTHFIDLSLAPEQLLSVSRELSLMYPPDAEQYKQIARSAYNHALTERSKNSARKPGILW